MRIIEADDAVTLAQAIAVLRLTGFTRAADDLADDGTRRRFELVLIALDDDGRAVGVAHGRRASWVVETYENVERMSALLAYLAVDPARRRLGIGTELVSTFCERSREAGAEQVVLTVGDVGPARAAELARFYGANGFVRTDYGFRRELVVSAFEAG